MSVTISLRFPCRNLSKSPGRWPSVADGAQAVHDVAELVKKRHAVRMPQQRGLAVRGLREVAEHAVDGHLGLPALQQVEDGRVAVLAVAGEQVQVEEAVAQQLARLVERDGCDEAAAKAELAAISARVAAENGEEETAGATADASETPSSEDEAIDAEFEVKD